MRKNKKTVAKSDFFRRISLLIERLIFVRGKIYDGVRFFLFFEKERLASFYFIILISNDF